MFKILKNKKITGIGIILVIVLLVLLFSFRGLLVINTDPSKASILITNNSYNKKFTSPLKKFLPFGKYKITVEKEGFQKIEQDIEIKRGQNKFSFTLNEYEEEPALTPKEEVIAILPISTQSWDIEYIPKGDFFSVTIKELPIEENKTKVLEWFKSQGLDPNTVKIYFDIPSYLRGGSGP